MHQSGPPYLPMFESVSVLLMDGRMVTIIEIDPAVAQKADEAETTLKSKDRTVWALRHFKKALIGELLWRIQHKPQLFQQRFGSSPASDQSNLHRQLQELDWVRLEDLKCYFDTGEPLDFWGEPSPPPCTGFEVIDEINERIGHYLQLAEKHKEHPAAKVILELEFKQQTFGEIKSSLRRLEIQITGGGR